MLCLLSWRRGSQTVCLLFWHPRSKLMTDIFSRKKRSQIMASVKGRDTLPEMLVRNCLRRLRCRYRSNVKLINGTPDIVLVGQKKLIFVHGCFWHGHKRCPRSKRPTANRSFWNKKLDGNIERDKRLCRALRVMNWKVLVVWECETRNSKKLLRKIERFVNET